MKIRIPIEFTQKLMSFIEGSLDDQQPPKSLIRTTSPAEPMDFDQNMEKTGNLKNQKEPMTLC